MTTEIKTCANCKTSFVISADDRKFFGKVGPIFDGVSYPMGEPTTCPPCRQKQRLAFRNEMELYMRECAGCKKQIVSVYSPDKPYHVYCQACWWSDRVDSVDAGRDFDFSRPFFEQFNEIMHDAKHLQLIAKNNENSDYVNNETDGKNCYMNVGGHYNEDCYYNTYSLWGKNNVDNYWVVKSELLYESVRCTECFSSSFLEYCESCINCHYCKDCRGCESCFGSYGLRHKKYCFFNKPMSKDAYEAAVADYLKNTEGRSRALAESQKHFLGFPHRASRLINCVDCTGDELTHCKNVKEGYWFENSEDAKYVYIGVDVKDTMDLDCFGWGELLYNCASSGRLNRAICATSTADSEFVQYCFGCFNSSYLFGCASVRSKKYCVFNKQYSKEEYEALVPKIIAHMRKTEEWGQFFPFALSLFGYNETVAYQYYPLEKEQALTQGSPWKERDAKKYQEPTYHGSHDIEEVPDTVVNEILACADCERNYRIIKPELAFYRKMNVPLPEKCLQCRNARRLGRRNPQKLWDRKCQKCNIEIKTAFASNRPEKVYCEQCYLKEVY